MFPEKSGLDHGVGHPPAASGSCPSPAAPEAKCVRGRRRAAERSHRAETVSAAHDLCPRFSQERSAVMVPAPGRLHIGGAAYFVWAYPSNCGRTAYRPGQVYRRTTVEYPTVADAMIEITFFTGLEYHIVHLV